MGPWTAAGNESHAPNRITLNLWVSKTRIYLNLIHVVKLLLLSIHSSRVDIAPGPFYPHSASEMVKPNLEFSAYSSWSQTRSPPHLTNISITHLSPFNSPTSAEDVKVSFYLMPFRDCGRGVEFTFKLSVKVSVKKLWAWHPEGWGHKAL